MRLTSVTQEGCDSFDPLPDVAGDCSSCVWLKVSVWRLVVSASLLLVVIIITVLLLSRTFLYSASSQGPQMRYVGRGGTMVT